MGVRQPWPWEASAPAVAPADPLAWARELAARAAGDPNAENRWHRETISRMTGQLVAGGQTPERAREIAVTAARRHDGEAVEYRQRS
jgi:hypothetical protein